MTYASIAIIGAGHMGMGLLGGMIANGYPAEKIFIADPASEKLQQAKNLYKVSITNQNKEAVKLAEVVIMAVKPDQVKTIATELAETIQQRKPLVISVAAGICETYIQQWLGGDIPIVRAMPNTPALIGCGATGLYANRSVSNSQYTLAESILRSVGIVVWLDNEALMDSVTALSGSGPAYFYLIIEAMQAAGEQMGLSKEAARLLTLQTAYGATRLALESEKPASELRQQAMTPGGTTEQALSVLEKHHIRETFAAALTAAAKRAQELDALYGKE